MKILFVEDNIEVIRGLIDTVDDRSWLHNECGFSNVLEKIGEFNPDIVVMDWMLDADQTREGADVFQEIVDNEFRPVIVFSAIDLQDIFETIQRDYPLVRYIRKGGDDLRVLTEIDKWVQYPQIISDMRKSMNRALIESSRAIENFIQMPEFPGEKIVKYMLSKRATQFFDEIEIGENPPAWIQYEYPPLSRHLLVGDVLRKKDNSGEFTGIGRAADYVIVLTPSCDLAHTTTGKMILVAEGFPKSNYYLDCNLEKDESPDSASAAKKKDILRESLTQGYRYSMLPIPELPNILPYMCFNLRKISFIPIEKIAINKNSFDTNVHDFLRLASVSSPFREQIVWANMNYSCRPGVPERDYVSWAEGILQK
ncbi:hypothetical protein SDC9_92596 [bioreactor metagenome]|uniref:Response regulatory domain-containing protein n=1 Tax=bioreactor metagenome TaxID=1076179 RepID=A0A645A834_9ZZZZ